MRKGGSTCLLNCCRSVIIMQSFFSLVIHTAATSASPPLSSGTGHMSNEAIDFRIFVNAGLPLRSFKAGETIFNEGEPATEFYCVQNGRVAIASSTSLRPTAFSARWRWSTMRHAAPPLLPRLMSRWPRFPRSSSFSVSVKRLSLLSRSCVCWHTGCARRTKRCDGEMLPAAKAFVETQQHEWGCDVVVIFALCALKTSSVLMG